MKQSLPAGKRIDSEGFVCLAGHLLWKYRAVDAEFRNAHLALVQKQAELDAELQKHEKIRALLLDKATIARLAGEKKSELQGVHHEIESVIGVSLANCAIDDQTGRVGSDDLGACPGVQ
jgi:hypothetical protein